MADQSLVAVLIDCDNISHRHVEKILAEAAAHGTLSVRRAYGDWHSPLLNGWREVLSSYAIQPIHQPAYTTGKNSTDSALIIDAMDLLYADHVGVFCLVTSDSDYTRLAMRLRESARRVFGIGSRTAANAFQKACDRFTWLELIDDTVAASLFVHDGPTQDDDLSVRGSDLEAKPTASLKNSLVALEEVLLPALRAKADDQGWAPLATVGHYVVGVNSSFDSRAYGYEKLGLLVRAQTFLEVEERVDPHGARQLWVRAHPEGS